MTSITVKIPDDVYQKMKKYGRARWSEIAGRAIIEYLSKLEEGGFETTTRELLEELGEEFKKSLSELSFDEAVQRYERMRHEEWKRLSTTQAP